MNTTLVHCYIYYRVTPRHAAAARQVIGTVFRKLEERAGISARLLQGLDDPALWMEVYENVRDLDRFEAILNDLLDAHRFSTFLAPGSARKTEHFVANTA